MQLRKLNKYQAEVDLDDRETMILFNIFREVKNILTYEPEFETRVDAYYDDVEDLIASISTKKNLSLYELNVINNILNEACNGVIIENFDTKIGISKIETRSYLKAINEIVNELRNDNNPAV